MSADGEYRIRVVSKAEFEEQRRSWVGPDYFDRVIAMCRTEGITYFASDNTSPGSWFIWLCPDCGCDYHNQIGEVPVSGWQSPAWTISGYPDAITLAPSLGCGRMLSPNYSGGHHWWARDGVLVPA